MQYRVVERLSHSKANRAMSALAEREKEGGAGKVDRDERRREGGHCVYPEKSNLYMPVAERSGLLLLLQGSDFDS